MDLLVYNHKKLNLKENKLWKNRLNEGPQKDKLLALLIPRLEDRDRVNYSPLAVSSRINFTCEYVDGDYINVSVL